MEHAVQQKPVLDTKVLKIQCKGWGLDSSE